MTRAPKVTEEPARPATMYMVKRLEMALRGQIEPIVRAAGLSVPQYVALTIVEADPGISSAEVARRTFVSAQAANELVNGLELKGLIRRTPNPGHAKILQIQLTDAGVRSLEVLDPLLAAVEEAMMAGMTKGDVTRFREALRRCIARVEDPTAQAARASPRT